MDTAAGFHLTRTTPESNARRAARGYSLIELLTVIAIISVVTGLAIPSFTAAAASSAISANANSLMASFDLARSEAISRNTMVSVCRASALRSAAPACSSAVIGNIGTSDWASGWIVFVKPEGTLIASSYDASADILLSRIEPDSVKPGGERSALVASPAQTLVAWAGNGLKVTTGGSAATIFTMDYRDPASTTPSVRARCLVLSVIGRTRSGRLSTAGVCDAI